MALVAVVYIFWPARYSNDGQLSTNPTVNMSPKTSWLKTLTVGLAAILPFSQVSCAHSFEASCVALASKVNIPNVHVYFAAFVPNGTNLTFPDNVCKIVFAESDVTG